MKDSKRLLEMLFNECVTALQENQIALIERRKRVHEGKANEYDYLMMSRYEGKISAIIGILTLMEGWEEIDNNTPKTEKGGISE